MRIWIASALVCFPIIACTQQAEPPADISAHSEATSSTSTQASQPAPANHAAASSEAPPTVVLPTDVREFIDLRFECEHWMGESPYDDDRRREILRGQERTCKGSDAKLSALRKKYRDTPAVIEALADYEDKIEP